MVACVEGCGEGFCGRQSNLRGEFLVRKMHGVGTFAGANKDTYKGSWTHNLQEEEEKGGGGGGGNDVIELVMVLPPYRAPRALSGHNA
ncbi:hypothetical protein AAHE18_16G194200 [Arachis hypogaea]